MKEADWREPDQDDILIFPGGLAAYREYGKRENDRRRPGTAHRTDSPEDSSTCGRHECRRSEGLADTRSASEPGRYRPEADRT